MSQAIARRLFKAVEVKVSPFARARVGEENDYFYTAISNVPSVTTFYGSCTVIRTTLVYSCKIWCKSYVPVAPPAANSQECGFLGNREKTRGKNPRQFRGPAAVFWKPRENPRSRAKYSGKTRGRKIIIPRSRGGFFLSAGKPAV